MTTATVSIGTIVSYTGGDGRVKTAVVVATPEAATLAAGSAVQVPVEGTVHLVVYGRTVGIYTKYDVPAGAEGTPHTFTTK